MTRIFLLTIIAAAFLSCTSCQNQDRYEVTLSSGDTAVYYLDEEEIDGQKILVLDHLSQKKATSEKIVEREVSEIWESARREAEKREFAEALIKYRYPQSEENEDNAGGNYRGLLFEAEKLENGTWKLSKVN